MRYTPITAKLKQNPLLASMALGSAGVAGLYLSFVHLMQTNANFANAVGQISPQLANTFACGCPFCTGVAAVCTGNDAFTTNVNARYQSWQQMLGHISANK
jgi:hypothetical protein